MPKTSLIYTNIDYKYLFRVLEVGLTSENSYSGVVTSFSAFAHDD